MVVNVMNIPALHGAIPGSQDEILLIAFVFIVMAAALLAIFQRPSGSG